MKADELYDMLETAVSEGKDLSKYFVIMHTKHNQYKDGFVHLESCNFEEGEAEDYEMKTPDGIVHKMNTGPGVKYLEFDSTMH